LVSKLTTLNDLEGLNDRRHASSLRQLTFYVAFTIWLKIGLEHERRKWPRPRRDRDVGLPRPRRWQL